MGETELVWMNGAETGAGDSQTVIKRCLMGRQESGASGERGHRVGADVGEGAQRSGGQRASDTRAITAAIWGQMMSEPSLVTPAGIRQTYPLFEKAPHLKWDRDALRGLMYLHTDRGPMKAWLHQLGRAPDPRWPWGGIQNAAHVMASGCMGGRRRKWEEIWSDPEFCGEVTRFFVTRLGELKAGELVAGKTGGGTYLCI